MSIPNVSSLIAPESKPGAVETVSLQQAGSLVILEWWDHRSGIGYYAGWNHRVITSLEGEEWKYFRPVQWPGWGT